MSKDIREFFNVKAFVTDLVSYRVTQKITTVGLAIEADVNPRVLREMFRHQNWHVISLITFLKLCKAADLSVEKYVV